VKELPSDLAGIKNMDNWITYPLKLSGDFVDLIPLEIKHFSALELISKDKRIWEFYSRDGSEPDNFLSIFTDALIERDKGNQFPFVIIRRQEQKIIGSTRFMDIQPKHKKLEIGWTWLQPECWATPVNLECKLLLLTFCFEQLMTVRVQLKTDENNWRSRKAIEKIGAHFEGILRNDMIRDNHTYRNSAYYSIIESEWRDRKNRLTAQIKAKREARI
jgi:RimJ/RimL family protein N-acetyltransferase